jgi:hypothetical protein
MSRVAEPHRPAAGESANDLTESPAGLELPVGVLICLAIVCAFPISARLIKRMLLGGVGQEAFALLREAHQQRVARLGENPLPGELRVLYLRYARMFVATLLHTTWDRVSNAFSPAASINKSKDD